MGQLPGRKSIPILPAGARPGWSFLAAADYCIDSHSRAASASKPVEFEYSEADQARLDRIRELYRKSDGSHLDDQAIESIYISRSQALYARRRELSGLLNDSEYRSAAFAEFAKSDGW